MTAKNILITGGAGFIGINTARYYLQKNCTITILDNFSRKGSKENIKWLASTTKKKFRVIEADIVKDKKVLREEINTADIVFHFAAQVAVTTSVKKPLFDFNVNALGTLHVLEAIRKSEKKPILIYSSTNKVYGDLGSMAVVEQKKRYTLKDYPHGVKEDYPVNFKSPYGCSKGAGDQYVHDYHTIYGLKTIVFRQSCIYGPHQFGIVDQGWLAWFIIAFMLGKQVSIYGNGKQVRDLLYIDDLINAYDLAITHIDKTQGGIYNIGGGSKNTISIWEELRSILEKKFDRRLDPVYNNERLGDQKIFYADIRAAKRDFGWQPAITINEGIDRLYTWINDNKQILKHYF
jgi:CDP-paratose 2-epimerase